MMSLGGAWSEIMSGNGARPRLACVVIYSVFVIAAIADYAASFDLERLLDPNTEIIGPINNYVHQEEKRLDELKKISKNLAGDKVKYDALSLFKAVKHLAGFKTLIEDKPNIQEDHGNAARALFRLQDTYSLDTSDMANGNLDQSKPYSCKLRFTARDCFELGQVAFDEDPPDHYHALLWFLEAQDRLNSENPETLDEKEMLFYLSTSLYHQGNLERAVLSLQRLQNIDRDFPGVEEDLQFYRNELKERHISLDTLEGSLPHLHFDRQRDWRFPDENVYEQLCRGELNPIEQEVVKIRLSCYFKRDNGFLKLAPLKAELIHQNPRIVIFRNVISMNEAVVMKKLAREKLAQSIISTTLSLDVAKYRTSRTAWLADADDPVISSLSKRVEDISGLTCETAEKFQVAKYELGGHYMPHFDFAGDERKHQFANIGTGDRIATVLFYISETPAGGATTFPRLRLTVYPQQYDALVWFNLLRNGEGDGRTRHAACPVLLGEKWIANKWLHEYGQEFRRKCALEKTL